MLRLLPVALTVGILCAATQTSCLATQRIRSVAMASTAGSTGGSTASGSSDGGSTAGSSTGTTGTSTGSSSGVSSAGDSTTGTTGGSSGGGTTGLVGPTPALFFTDVTFAVNQSNETNEALGSYVTIYGEGFGATRGTARVLVGGVEVSRYLVWGENNAPARSLDRVVVQLGPEHTASATNKEIVMERGGATSNSLSLRVLGPSDGKVVWVDHDAAAGCDIPPSAPGASGPFGSGGTCSGDTLGNCGTRANPYRRLPLAKCKLTPGTIVYVAQGRYEEQDPDDPTTRLALSPTGTSAPNGTASQPIAIVANPTATAAVQLRPIAATATRPIGNYLENTRYYVTIAGFDIARFDHGIAGTVGSRFVGNRFDAVGTETRTGAVIIRESGVDVAVLGNYFTGGGGVNSAAAIYMRGSDFVLGDITGARVSYNEVVSHSGPVLLQVAGDTSLQNKFRSLEIASNRLVDADPSHTLIAIGGTDLASTAAATQLVHSATVFNNELEGAGRLFLFNDNFGPEGGAVRVLHNTMKQGYVQVESSAAGALVWGNNVLHAPAATALFQGAAANAWSEFGTNLMWVGDVGATGQVCPNFAASCVLMFPTFESGAVTNAGVRTAPQPSPNLPVLFDFSGKRREFPSLPGARE